jgi:Flp pilus assembly secretin CpaC
MLYTMLLMTILNIADGEGSPDPELAKVAGAPAIGVVKLDAARLATSVNRSEVIESESPIDHISVGDPEILEVVATNGREVVVHAKAAGETTLTVWSATEPKLLRVVVLKKL